MKIIITVQGGVVQSVHSSNPDVTVEILDYDDGEAEGGEYFLEQEKRITNEMKTMTEIC